MTSNPDEIRGNIEHTRNELSSDVNALTDKVSPRRVAGDKADRARSSLHSIKEKIMGSASHTGEAARSSASEAAHRASATSSSIRERAGDVTHRQRERAQGSPLAAGLVAFGLGALISALLPPSTKEQQLASQAKGTASAHSGELKQQATSAAKQVQGNLREPAQQAVGSVKSRATEGVSNVQEQGRSAAADVRGQAKEATETVRRQ